MLSNYRVIELGMWVAGPAAGGLLADWGADVVKVETPLGDPMRRLFQLVSGHGQPESPPFDLDNRAKRSIVIDLARPEGTAVIKRLLADADVFVTNLRPDAVERLGLDADTICKEFPRLVYASVSGYGRTGPDQGRAGYDVGAFWARSGIADLMARGAPAPPGNRSGMGDHVTAITTVAGILAALLERERTGRGQLVETSLLRTGIYTVGWDLGIHARYGKLSANRPRTSELNPMCNSYRAGDDRWFWLLGVEADRLWPKLCAALDRPDLRDDERYSTARERRHNAPELVAQLDEIFASSTRDELTAAFDREDVWWAPVNTPADVFEDPQAVAAGAFVEVPEGPAGPAHKAVATPVTFHGEPTGPIEAAPGLGEHTDQILRAAGYTDDELADLRRSGAVG